MKNLLFTLFLVAISCIRVTAQNNIPEKIQIRSVEELKIHTLSQTEGDTARFLTLNYREQRNEYIHQPASLVYESLRQAGVEIKSTYPVFLKDSERYVAYYLFLETREQLKEKLERGEKIHAIGLYTSEFVTSQNHKEAFEYSGSQGYGNVIPWSMLIEEATKNGIIYNFPVSDATSTVREALERYP